MGQHLGKRESPTHSQVRVLAAGVSFPVLCMRNKIDIFKCVCRIFLKRRPENEACVGEFSPTLSVWIPAFSCRTLDSVLSFWFIAFSFSQTVKDFTVSWSWMPLGKVTAYVSQSSMPGMFSLMFKRIYFEYINTYTIYWFLGLCLWSHRTLPRIQPLGSRIKVLQWSRRAATGNSP